MVAAEKDELAGIAARLEAICALDWSIQYAACGLWKGQKLTLVANGPGRDLALRALKQALEHDTFDAVVSTGFCGGLDPELQIGSIVAATDVRDSDGRRYSASLPQQSGAETGPIVSSNRVAVSVAEKAGLRRASGARAVEMEAIALAEAALEAGMRFYCVRAVSDAAQEAMPLDFNLYRDRDGRFDRRRIALAAMARPVHRIPGLIRLRRNCRIAASKLGDFFADWNP